MTTTNNVAIDWTAVRGAIKAAMDDKKKVDPNFGLRELERRTNLAHGALGRFLNEKSKAMDLDSLAAIAGAFEIPLAELIGLSTSPAPVEGSAAASDERMRWLRPAQLEASKTNPRKRFGKSELDELADSIASRGLLQNLVVRPHPTKEMAYIIVAGERRFRAIKKLVKDKRWPADREIPCLLIVVDESDTRVDAILENIQRVDLTPIEEAEAFKALQDLDAKKWTTAAIAAKVGRTQRFVQQRLALLTKLAEPVRKALASGKINFDTARAMMIATPERQEQMLPQVKRGDYGYQNAKDIRESAKRGLVPIERAIFDNAKVKLETIEDPETGALFFTDSDAFKKQQQKAVEAKVKELEKEWAWARFEHYCYTGNYGQSDDRKNAGVIVTMDYTGEVEIHTGLVERHEKSAASERDERWKAEQAEREEQNKERDSFSEDLRAKLRDEKSHLLKLVVFEFLCTDDGACGMYCEGDMGDRIHIQVKVLGLKEDADDDAIWATIDKLSDIQLYQSFFQLVAGTVGANRWGEAQPVIILTAKTFGVEVPTHMLPKSAATKTPAADVETAPPVTAPGPDDDDEDEPAALSPNTDTPATDDVALQAAAGDADPLDIPPSMRR